MGRGHDNIEIESASFRSERSGETRSAARRSAKPRRNRWQPITARSSMATYTTGASYEKLRDQVLDRYGYHRAVLTHDLGQYATNLNPYFTEAICRAVNDWNIATWLNYDERLYGLAVAPIGNPEQAVAE